MPRIFLSAGEASGEHYGALLIESLRKLDPAVEIFGMGGQRMGTRLPPHSFARKTWP